MEMPVSCSMRMYAGERPEMMAASKKHHASAQSMFLVLREVFQRRGSSGSSVG